MAILKQDNWHEKSVILRSQMKFVTLWKLKGLFLKIQKTGYGGIVNKQQAELLNGIALAYIGDAIYEVFVREYLLDKGLTKPAMLQKNATKFVSAKAQAKIISAMDEVDFLTEYELTYFKPDLLQLF